MINWT